MVQPIGNGCRGGFVDEPQHVQASQLGGILGGLPLSVIKVGRHGDHCPVQIIVEGVFSAVTQGGEDFGTHLDRRLLTGTGLQRQHTGLVDKLVGQLLTVGNVGQPAPHETLDRHQRVGRVL